MITLQQRVKWYAESEEGKRYPDSVPVVSPSGRWMTGHWIMGQDYRNKSPLYGAYPPRYIERVRALFPRVPENRILHVFSGSVPEGKWTRLDISNKRDPPPDIRADITNLSLKTKARIIDKRFRLTMADTPYGEEDAEHYETPMPGRSKSFRSLADVLVPGSHLVWLDTTIPMFRKSEWMWWGSVTLLRSTNHRVREAFFFLRV